MEAQGMVYRVPKLPGPIVINGNWDKPVWQGIQVLEITNHMGGEPVHRPLVAAKLTWDDSALFLIFRVADRYVRAVAAQYQDPVCRDSCVEFFFTPGENLGLSYFNLEINCGGVMLFGWHPEGKKVVPVAAEDAASMEIAHSLPKRVEPEIEEPVTWTVEYRLPFSLIRKYCPGAPKPAPGVIWKANFYKCADATSHPHWLTWSPVDHPVPKFHLPQYFGTLAFG